MPSESLLLSWRNEDIRTDIIPLTLEDFSFLNTFFLHFGHVQHRYQLNQPQSTHTFICNMTWQHASLSTCIAFYDIFCSGIHTNQTFEIVTYIFRPFGCFFLPFLFLLFSCFCYSCWPSTGLASSSKIPEWENNINLCKKAFFFISSISHIRKYLPPHPLKRLVNALVISHVDYCNSLLCGLSSNELAELQIIQNTAARLIVGARRFNHIMPILRDLHWLPIPARLEFKILLLKYKCFHNQVHLNSVTYSSFANLHGHFAPPCNSYFRAPTALTPSSMTRGCLPSLLLNCGALYLNTLSQPCPCQLLKQHLKRTFLPPPSWWLMISLWLSCFN